MLKTRRKQILRREKRKIAAAKTAKETLENAEAGVKESDSNAEMAVRRGGRGRRRPNERSDQKYRHGNGRAGIAERTAAAEN